MQPHSEDVLNVERIVAQLLACRLRVLLEELAYLLLAVRVDEHPVVGAALIVDS